MLTIFVESRTSLFSRSRRPICVTFAQVFIHKSHKADLVVHVGAGVDALLGELRKGDLEALLDRLEDSLVIRAADEGDTETLGTETTSTTDTVEVRVGLVGHVVVDSDVNTLDIDTTTKDVSRHTDTGLEVLELLVTLNTVTSLALGIREDGLVHIPLLLTDARVNCGTGEVALAQKLVELCAAQSRADEDDNLVELQFVQKVVKLPVLLTLIELHVVLLQTVQSQFLLVVDVDLERVLHELLAGLADLLCEGGGEHHNLLVGGCSAEDGLDIIAHV